MNLIKRFLAWLFGKSLSLSLPQIGHRTIFFPLDFIVQRCIDGSLATVHDQMTERRHDWPLPIGWGASDSVLLPDGRALQTFDFVRTEHDAGDGCQILSVGADGWVRIDQTRDGGKAYMQYFVGPKAGGTGWIAFGADATTGAWRSVVATLKGSNWQDERPSTLDRAFTRYRLEVVSFLFAVGGVEERRSLRTIISEHYDRETISASAALERSYFAEGYGLLRWEAWGRTSEAPITDLPLRYQWAAFSDPPGAGWYLDDVRTWTNVVACPPTTAPMTW